MKNDNSAKSTTVDVLVEIMEMSDAKSPALAAKQARLLEQLRSDEKRRPDDIAADRRREANK